MMLTVIVLIEFLIPQPCPGRVTCGDVDQGTDLAENLSSSLSLSCQ